MGEIGDLKNQLAIEKSEKQRLDDLMEKIQDDKKKLAHRVNKLTANGKYMAFIFLVWMVFIEEDIIYLLRKFLFAIFQNANWC